MNDFDLDEFRHNVHQGINEEHGLYCYGKDGNDRLWSLWRENDDTQLTPWLDLGPGGFIWVLHSWDHEHKDGSERQHMLILEQEDDPNAQTKRWALMHTPSGRQTQFIFTHEPKCLDDRLFAERDGLWGWADSTGKLIGTLHATDSDALLDEPC